MITITNIRNVDYKKYDEVWAIVRSIRNLGMMHHVPELSPSWNLFKRYLQLRDVGKWNTETFRSVYVPIFLEELKATVAHRKLEELIESDSHGEDICLVCFCSDELTCHRSIIAGVLQYIGIQVLGVQGDYSQYGRLF